MTRGRRKSRDILGRFSALSMAAVVLLSAFSTVMSSAISASAASSTISSGTSLHIGVTSDAASDWSGELQVRFLDESGNALGSAQTVTSLPADVRVPSEADGAYQVQIDKIDPASQSVLNEINSIQLGANQDLLLFDNSTERWSNVGIYTWRSSTENHAWPGVSVTTRLTSDSAIYYAIVDRSRYDWAIFNNYRTSGTSQTGNLSLPGTGGSRLYVSRDGTSFTMGEYVPSSQRVTAYFSERETVSGTDKNSLYLTSATTAQWSKYDGTENTYQVYFKPNRNWTGGTVTYDEDDPATSAITLQYYTDTEGNVYNGTDNSPQIFQANVPAGVALTFHENATGGQTVSARPYTAGASENTYVASKMQWDTLANAMTTESDRVHWTVGTNNFDSATASTGGTSVVGVSATYFDYLSNNEMTSGWLRNLNDGAFTDDDNNYYRRQFSNFNNAINSLALSDTNWRYPLYFGDDYNAGFYINGYYNSLSSSRTGGINQAYFQAVNNSNFLNYQYQEGYNNRSVLGLVQNTLNGGNLMVTSNTKAPWFDNDFLYPVSEGGEETIDPNALFLDFSDYTTLSDASAWFAAYFYDNSNSSKNTWVAMTQVTGESYVYTCQRPNDPDYDTVIFCRMNPAYSTTSWDHRWNQTANLTLSSTSNSFKVSGYGSGNPALINGSWTTYSSGSSSTEYAKIIQSEFPFVTSTDSNGVTTYSFDSTNAKDNVYFNYTTDSSGNYVPTSINYAAGSSYGGSYAGIDNKFTDNGKGIFPFTNTSNQRTRDYGFGIKMEIEFTLPENGVYTSTGGAPTSNEVWIQTGVSWLQVGDGSTWCGVQLEDSLPKKTGSDGKEYYVITQEWLNNYTGYSGNKNYFAFNPSGSGSFPSYPFSANWGHAIDNSGQDVTSTLSYENSEPAIFEYSGDDDLWVFVDGQLVLDLGGAHTPTTGRINFGAGTNTVTSTADNVSLEVNGEPNGTTDTRRNGSSVEKTFTINNTDPTRKHTLTVFYMERGTNDSNLKVSFSVQPTTHDLTIGTRVTTPNINTGLTTAVNQILNNTEFTYAVTQQGSAFADKSYAITRADDTTTSGTTSTTGSFTQYRNWSAYFNQSLAYNDAITVTQSDTSPFTFTTSWTAMDNKTYQQFEGAAGSGNTTEAAYSMVNMGDDGDSSTTGDPSLGSSVTNIFYNELQVGNLSLSKLLYQENSEELSEASVPFDFTVLIDLNGGNNYQAYNLQYRVGDETTTHTATNGHITLYPNDTVTFINIPVGATYQITEQSKDGYKIKSITGADSNSGYVATGEIAASGTTYAVTYGNEESSVSADLQAQKTLDGNLYSGSDFEFVAELLHRNNSDGTQTTTADLAADGISYGTDFKSTISTVATDGYVTFEEFNIIASTDNVGDYVFKITESPTASDSLYQYDSNEYYAVITVTSGAIDTPKYYSDENLTTEITTATGAAAPPTFNNTTKGIDVEFIKYDDNGTTPLSNVEFKIYTDSDCTNQYTTNAVGDPIGTNGTVTSGTDGKVLFEKLAYSTTTVTNYYIQETKTISGHQLLAYPIVVTIGTDGNYTLSYNGTTLTKPEGGSFSITNNALPDLPLAGGSGVVPIVVTGVGLVLLSGAGYIIYRRRRVGAYK